MIGKGEVMFQRGKIRFIEPQSRPGRPFNAWITWWPLLGPIILATILKHRGYDAGVYNENISGSILENEEAFKDILSSDVVGISIMTPTAARGYTLAERLRQHSPAPRIVFGGVHATFCPEEALRYGDVVVSGEGETVIEEIASGKIRHGIVEGKPVEDLDTLPTLDHFVMRDFHKMMKSFGQHKQYELPVMTSRGCPHGCQYCTVSRMFGNKVRRQSVGKVFEDVRFYAEQGFRHLFFYDDNFTTDRDWTRSLLERLEPMGLHFNAQVRVDFHWQDRSRSRCDHALLEAMRRGGADKLFIGYETVDDSTAREWHKGYSGKGSLVSRLVEDTRILHDKGFWIHGMFVLGPQHTEKTASEILRFALRSKLETLQISVLTPFPGTPLLEQVRPYLILNDFPADWDYYDGTHCVYSHGRLGIERFQKLLIDTHQKFYVLGTWSLHRLRLLLHQRISLKAKLALLWSNARIIRNTLRAWKEETKVFLNTVKARTSQAMER